MSTSIDPEPRTVEEELEFRRRRQQVIGGSDLRKIFLGKWGDAREVYYEKTRPIDEEEVREDLRNGTSVDLDRGTTFEPIIADRFFRRTDRRGRDERRRAHPDYPFLNPEPDRIQFAGSPGAPADGTGALEIKAPRAGGFAKVAEANAVRDGDLLQLQYQMLCRGYRWGTHVYGSWESSKGPILYFDVTLSEELARFLEERLVEFWRHHVEERIPPDPDEWLLADTGPALPQPVGSDYWTPESAAEAPEEIYDLVEDAKRLQQLRKDASEEYDEVRDRIAEWIREEHPEFAGVSIPGVGKAKIIQQSGRTRLDSKAVRKSRPIDRDAFVRWYAENVVAAEGNPEAAIEAAEQVAEDLELEFEEFESEGSPSEYVGIY